MAMTQEQFQAIQLQLASSEQQVLTLSNMIDKVRSEASNAVRELREGLAAEIAKTTLLQQAAADGGGHSSREWSLVSSKEFGAGRLGGAKAESFEVCSKKVKIFVNGNWVGVHRDPDDLVNNLRQARRSGQLGEVEPSRTIQ